MILGRQVEWALHCCAVLAAQPTEAALSTRDLAEFHGVPKEYLSKALQALATAGILAGSLGPQGGYRLNRDPDHISFLDVVEAVEGPQATFACTNIKDNNPCLRGQPKSGGLCAVAKVMAGADEAWRQELRSVSLRRFTDQLAKDLGKPTLERNAAWFAGRR